MRHAAPAATAAWLALAGAAEAAHGPTYRGEYANAFVAGRAADGREVAVMAGVHAGFPYHHPGSDYDQVAVHVDGAEPLVATSRPKLDRIALDLGEAGVRLAYAGPGVAFRLHFAAVRHRPRIEGDPAQLGDTLVGLGADPTESPGFVYTPYDLMTLTGGELRLRGRVVPLANFHGQAEAGRVAAPTDPAFRSAYDYLAAPSLDGPPYTWVAFSTRALHGGALDAYLRATASDAMTLEAGTLHEGNARGAPEPFQNRRGLPRRGRVLAQWATDLGPGILWRKLVRAPDREGRVLMLLSETIEEDPGPGPEAVAPVVSRARARPSGALEFALSEDALVSGRRRGGGWTVLGRFGAGSNMTRAAGRPLRLRATDEAGNRSRAARVRR